MDLSRKRVLVVDDHPGMLGSLRRALEACGIASPHLVRSAHEAVQRLRNMRYDIVLTDFDLGPGPDGQQLLEHCRAENLLAPPAVFLVVTAERAYDRVMSAAEFVPDDYLVKPFTEDILRLRLLRALDRRQILAPIYAQRAKGNNDAVVSACEHVSVTNPRYAAEAARLKIEALLALHRFTQVRDECQRVLARRSVPWARLGFARALEGLGETDKARVALTELLADAPEYLPAYDALSQLHGKTENTDDAKAVLRMALEVSPNALHRHKAIGEIALRTADLDTAEQAFGMVVRKGRNGFVRSPDDHLCLSRILMQRNKFAQALETLADVKRAFRDSPAVKVSAAVVESQIYNKADNPREARKAFEQALAVAKEEDVRIADDIALELARACYRFNHEQDGAELVKRLVANNHDNQELVAAVRNMYSDLDRSEQGETIIERAVGDAVEVNNEGVNRAKSGDLEGAIELLERAAAAMPDNVQIVMNAAHSLIAHMQLHGTSAEMQGKVAAYLERARSRNPTHPKYLQVLALSGEFGAPAKEVAA
jgi:CheY-like chemotaxis protein/predicted Zn-dependent protease